MKIFYFILALIFALVGCDNHSESQPKATLELSPAPVAAAMKGHLAATEKNIFLVTDVALYRRRAGDDGWVRTALTIPHGTNVTSMIAVERPTGSVFMEVPKTYWTIYMLMDAGGMWGFVEGEEDLPRVTIVSTPE